jgi:hypothetical protein
MNMLFESENCPPAVFSVILLYDIDVNHMGLFMFLGVYPISSRQIKLKFVNTSLIGDFRLFYY